MMSINYSIEIPNRIVYMAIALVTLLIIAGGVYASFPYSQTLPKPGHGGDKIIVSIPNAGEMTLQNAITTGKIRTQGLKGSIELYDCHGGWYRGLWDIEFWFDPAVLRTCPANEVLIGGAGCGGGYCGALSSGTCCKVKVVTS